MSTSPFAFFRKYQKTMMVAVTGLAMVSFVFLGTATGSGGQSSPALIGAIFGAAILWFVSVIDKKKKGTQYALAGALLGGLLGQYLLVPGKAAAVVETDFGSFSTQELQQLIYRRRTANRFVQEAFARTSENEFRQVPQGALFGFGKPIDQDVILGRILEEEAKKMGIVVSDEAVNSFILELAQNKLSKKDFREIRMEMKLKETELYDIFKEQLAARLAMRMSAPFQSNSPEEYWQTYRKLNVREELDITAIPVDAFTAEAPDPNEGDIVAFFEEHKAVFENELGPGEPGFRQPRKVQLAYLEADFETLEGLVDEVTDKEIEAYFEANYNTPTPTIPDTKDATPKEEGPSLGKPATETPEPEKKTEPEKKPEPENKTEEQKPAEEKPADSKPKPKKEAPKKEESAEKKKDDSAGAAFFVADEIPKDEKKEPAKEEATEDKKGEEKPKAAVKPVTDAPVEATKPTTETPATEEKPDEPQKLTDDLRSEIRDQLLREKTLVAMQGRVDAASEYVRDLGYEFKSPIDDSKKMTPEELVAQLNSYAKEHGLIYRQTGFLTYMKLQESEDHPIGSAQEPVDNPFDQTQMQNALSVPDQLFTTQPEQTYIPYLAQDSLTSNRYAYWKTAEQAAEVPTLEDEGIRDEVITAWKLQQAIPKAKARAEALAELARKGADDVTESLAGQTVTGKEDDLEVTVMTTESFSWLRISSAASNNPFAMQPPEISTISAVENPGDKFMEVVFNDLKNGEVGVASNADESIYYVVKVKDRFPANKMAAEIQRAAFMKENLFMFSPYMALSSREQQQANYDWSVALENSYNVHWNERTNPEQDQ